MSYLERVDAPGPKKLLALDGGGVRGVITLEVLARLEEMLGNQLGAGDDFVLADYLDYIGGTSTGAVIAAGLATGHRVDELLRLYTERGEEMFDKASLLRRYRYRFRYDSDRLDREVGDLMSGRGLLEEPLFSYVRYNAELTRDGLDRLDLPDVRPEDVERLDSVQHIGDLRRMGRAVARDVDVAHFAGFVDAPS